MENKKNENLAVQNNELEFLFLNGNKRAVIYITNNSDQNKIIFRIKNDTGNKITLKGGPVSEQNPPPADGPATFRLGFSDSKLNEQLTINKANWNAESLDLDGTSLWGLSPKNDLTLAQGETIDIQLNNLTPDGSKSKTELFYEWYNISGVENGGNIMTISILPLPDVSLKKLNLNYGFVEPNVYISDEPVSNPVVNYLQFYLSNGTSKPLIAKTTPWGEQPPVFNIYFVFGKKPGYGALTTRQLGKQIELQVGEEYGGLWKIEKETSGQVISFSLYPVAGENHEIFGGYSNTSVEFKIGPIVTSLAVGITSMYIFYKNLPGYMAGEFVSTIFKRKAIPGIIDFLAFPATIAYKKFVNISWRTIDVDSVELQITAANKTKTLKSSEQQITLQESDYSLQCEAETHLTLSVFDEYGNLLGMMQREITVLLPDPIIQFNAKPILQFTKIKWQNHIITKPVESVKLSWKVKFANDNDGVTLDPSITREVFPSEGSYIYTKPVAGPITLTAIKSISDSEQKLTSKSTIELLFPALPLTPVNTLDFTTLLQEHPDINRQLIRIYKEGVLLINFESNGEFSNILVYYIDIKTGTVKKVFDQGYSYYAISQDGSKIILPYLGGFNWKLFAYDDSSKMYAPVKSLKMMDYRSTFNMTVSLISNDGNTIFVISRDFQKKSNGDQFKIFRIFNWSEEKLLLLGTGEIIYDKGEHQGHGTYYSEESGKIYTIPFNNTLYIIDQSAAFTTLNLKGFDLNTISQSINEVYVIENLNMIFVCAKQIYFGFVVFDLTTGNLVKSYTTFNSSPFYGISKNGIIGALTNSSTYNDLVLLLTSELPNAKNNHILSIPIIDQYGLLAISDDLKKMAVFVIKSSKTSLEIYEL